MDLGTSVIPVFERITKLLVDTDKRSTVAGPAANAAIGPVRPSTREAANTIAVAIEFLLSFFIYFLLGIYKGESY
jgi:hypothetical protein